MKNIFKNKIIMILGGSGSWGNELTKQLLELNPKEIRIYSRGEINQVAMCRKFLNPKLKFIIGDIRDLSQLTTACIGVDIVFLLAALKHVPICEEYPEEAIKTNINGTLNAIKASIDNNVSLFIDVSTDKQTYPVNTYGMTKAIGEKLVLNGNKIQNKTKFMIVRAGNVLGSNGSVVPHFINQIKTQGKITITDKRMTRYYITLPEAIGLLFTAISSDISGGIFVMKMPACKLIDLAEVLIEHFNPNTKIEYTGVRPGEKIHEVLVSEYEASNTYKYKNNYYLIDYSKQNLPKVDFKEYTSNTYIMNKKEIKDMLIKGGFLQ